MKKRVLIVDDAADTQLLAGAALSPEFDTIGAKTLSEARKQMSEARPDLLLLDVALPDGNGFEFCSEIRNQTSFEALPVIFLTGRGDAEDKIQGFRLGAQDYVTKPFHPTELKLRVVARLQSVLGAKSDELVYENIRIDLRRYELKISLNNGSVEQEGLSALELKLLRFFLEHPGRVLTRTDLLNEVWGQGASVTDRAVDSQVSHLRKKIKSSGFDIRSVYGTGYRFGRANAKPAA